MTIIPSFASRWAAALVLSMKERQSANLSFRGISEGQQVAPGFLARKTCTMQSSSFWSILAASVSFPWIAWLSFKLESWMDMPNFAILLFWKLFTTPQSARMWTRSTSSRLGWRPLYAPHTSILQELLRRSVCQKNSGQTLVKLDCEDEKAQTSFLSLTTDFLHSWALFSRKLPWRQKLVGVRRDGRWQECWWPQKNRARNARNEKML